LALMDFSKSLKSTRRTWKESSVSSQSTRVSLRSSELSMRDGCPQMMLRLLISRNFSRRERTSCQWMTGLSLCSLGVSQLTKLQKSQTLQFQATSTTRLQQGRRKLLRLQSLSFTTLSICQRQTASISQTLTYLSLKQLW